MAKKKQNYLWSDRKRVLGMPITFTRYHLSEDRLFLSTGFFDLKDEELLLYRVRDITTKRSLWQRIFRVGTITLASSDATQPVIQLMNVKNPMEVKETIHQQVEQQKIKRRVRISEISVDDDDFEDSDIPEDDPE